MKALLEEMLALWRETRSDELASAIAQLSTTNPRPPITGTSQRALQAAWIAVVVANDPLDVDRLVATLGNGNLTHANQRLVQLATRPADPRIAAGLEAVLANPPSAAFVKSSSLGFWNALFALLAAIADPRTTTIHERIAWLAHDRAASPFDVGTLRARTVAAIAKVAQAIPPAPELTPAQQAKIDALIARGRAIPRPIDRGAELLERIYEHPHDLDARSVYADWLTSQGDPRGEFIALQLARPLPTTRPWQWYKRRVPTREERLLRTHEKTWVGRLGAFLGHVYFERGFPAWGFLANEVDVSTIAIPEAATLEHLAVRRDDVATGRRLAGRPFHGLTSISAIGWDTLAGLLEQPGTTVRAVEISYGELPGDLKFLDRTDTPLSLLDLDFGHMTSPAPPTDRVHALLRTPVVDHLQTLCLGSNVGNDRAFIEAFVTSSITTLELRGPATHSIERLATGFRFVLDGEDPRGSTALTTLRSLVDAVEVRAE